VWLPLDPSSRLRRPRTPVGQAAIGNRWLPRAAHAMRFVRWIGRGAEPHDWPPAYRKRQCRFVRPFWGCSGSSIARGLKLEQFGIAAPGGKQVVVGT